MLLPLLLLPIVDGVVATDVAVVVSVIVVASIVVGVDFVDVGPLR